MILSPKHTPLWPMCFFVIWNWANQSASLNEVFQLNPNYPTAHQWYGRLTLLALGQFDHALAEAKRAVELDPVSPIGHTDVATVYMTGETLRRSNREVAQYFGDGAGLLLGPSAARIGTGIEGLANSEAIVEFQRAAELNDDPRVLAFVGHAMASTGKQNEAREMLAQLTEMQKRVTSPVTVSR